MNTIICAGRISRHMEREFVRIRESIIHISRRILIGSKKRIWRRRQGIS